jgi:hypothetical protein
LDGHPTDLLGNPLGPVAVKVRDQNSLRAFHGKSSTECSTDSVRSAGDNHYFARDIHNLSDLTDGNSLEALAECRAAATGNTTRTYQWNHSLAAAVEKPFLTSLDSLSFSASSPFDLGCMRWAAPDHTVGIVPPSIT